MLLFTIAFTALMILEAFGDPKELVFNNLWLYYLSLLMVIGTMISIGCFYHKFRAVPRNYILLGVYTFFHTYLVAAVAVQYSVETVISAAIATMLMFVALTGYAFWTKKDFTKLGGFLSTSCFMLIFLIIMASIMRSALMSLIVICIAIALLSIFIVYDTQLIIGGKSKY